jgi:hypothetical protein
MAYTGTLSARLSQFGKTYLTFRLVDGAGVMPTMMVEGKLLTETPTQQEGVALRNTLIAQATAAYNNQQQLDGDRAQIVAAFKNWMDEKVDDLNAQLQVRIESSGLNERRKALASQAHFTCSF